MRGGSEGGQAGMNEETAAEAGGRELAGARLLVIAGATSALFCAVWRLGVRAGPAGQGVNVQLRVASVFEWAWVRGTRGGTRVWQ